MAAQNNVGVHIALHGVGAFVAGTKSVHLSLTNLGHVAGKVGHAWNTTWRTMSKGLHSVGRLGSQIAHTMMRGFMVAGAGIAAAVGIVAYNGIKKFTDQASQVALLNAALASTGNVANTSTDAVLRMSKSLQDMSGVDSTKIQKSFTTFSSFMNIRNRPGAGNDIFNQAGLAALNISSKGGRPLDSIALQLGKALEDPVKGMVMLRRAGVTISADANKRIKHLVAMNNLLGAQKVLLDEINKRYANAASELGKTPLGMWRRAKEGFRDFSMEMVKTFAPIVLPILVGATHVLERLEKPINRLALQGKIRLKAFFDGVSGRTTHLNKNWNEWGKTARRLWDHDLLPGLQNVWRWVQNKVLPALGGIAAYFMKHMPAFKEFGRKVLKDIGDALNTIGNAIRDNGPALAQLGKDFLDFVESGIKPAARLIAGLITGIATISKFSDSITGHGKDPGVNPGVVTHAPQLSRWQKLARGANIAHNWQHWDERQYWVHMESNKARDARVAKANADAAAGIADGGSKPFGPPASYGPPDMGKGGVTVHPGGIVNHIYGVPDPQKVADLVGTSVVKKLARQNQ